MLKTNKRTFTLECQNKYPQIDVNIHQIRVICVAKKYDKYDYNAIKHIDAAIELYTYNKYEELLDLNLIYKKPTPQSKLITKNNPESNPYTISTHIKADWQAKVLQDLTEKFTNHYGEDLEIVPLKYYIAFKAPKNLIALYFYKTKIEIFSKYFEKNSQEIIEMPHEAAGICKFIIESEADLAKFYESYSEKLN